jgi:glutathione S-transferase
MNIINSSYDTGLKSPNKRISQLNEIISDSESSYLLPDGFSLADVAVASYLLYVVQFFPDVNLSSRWPAIVKYMKDCASREGYGKAFGSNVQQFLLGKLEAQENGKKEKKLFGMF